MNPDRIVINFEGESVHPNRTDIQPDVIFIRSDGWSLGAPREFEKVACDMWYDEWAFFVIDEEKYPFSEYYYGFRNCRIKGTEL